MLLIKHTEHQLGTNTKINKTKQQWKTNGPYGLSSLYNEDLHYTYPICYFGDHPHIHYGKNKQ